jgi:sec-independent protein translocase protein TatB
VFNLGMGEITVILLLAIIFLGPKKLPDLASGLGKIIRDIRKATSDVKNEIALDDTFRKPFEELRDAVTLHPDELKRRDELKRSLEDIRKRAEALENEVIAPNESPSPEPVATAPSEATVTPEAGAALAAVDGPEGLPGEPSGPHASGPHAAHQPGAAPLFGPPTAPATSPLLRSRTTPPGGARTPPTIPPGRATPAAGLPTLPMAPPAGTISAPPTRIGPPRVTPPVSSLNSDKSNTTQSLSEEDLLPPAPPGHKASPPPLPGIVRPPPVPPGSKKNS